jgi:hypothetical protein
MLRFLFLLLKWKRLLVGDLFNILDMYAVFFFFFFKYFLNPAKSPRSLRLCSDNYWYKYTLNIPLDAYLDGEQLL